MSGTITLEEAQSHLKELIDRLAPGEEVVITENERAVAKLVGEGPVERKLGTLKGTVRYMAPDFDAPLDDFKEYMERYAEQLWFFEEDGAVRIETWRKAEDEEAEKSIRIVREKTAERDETGRPTADPLTCRGTDSALLTQLVRCGNYLEESTTIVLYSEGDLPSHDWTAAFKAWLYLDPASYLPVAARLWEGAPFGDEDGAPLELEFSYRYEHEFVDRDSLSTDFFVGTPEPDPAANLVPEVGGMRVYWLGRRFDPGGGLPSVTLMGAGTTKDDQRYGPTYRASIEYEGGTRNYPVIGFQEYSLDTWKQLARPGTGFVPEGTPVQQIVLPDGRADVFRTDDPDYERYRALVYFETTVVMVGDFDEPNSYSSLAAFVAVVKALRPYEDE